MPCPCCCWPQVAPKPVGQVCTFCLHSTWRGRSRARPAPRHGACWPSVPPATKFIFSNSHILWPVEAEGSVDGSRETQAGCQGVPIGLSLGIQPGAWPQVSASELAPPQPPGPLGSRTVTQHPLATPNRPVSNFLKDQSVAWDSSTPAQPHSSHIPVRVSVGTPQPNHLVRSVMEPSLDFL